MIDPQGLAQRLEALEMHAAHQAQVIDELNAAVAAQWTTIDALRRGLATIAERLESAEARGVGLPPVQKPPHY